MTVGSKFTISLTYIVIILTNFYPSLSTISHISQFYNETFNTIKQFTTQDHHIPIKVFDYLLSNTVSHDGFFTGEKITRKIITQDQVSLNLTKMVFHNIQRADRNKRDVPLLVGVILTHQKKNVENYLINFLQDVFDKSNRNLKNHGKRLSHKLKFTTGNIGEVVNVLNELQELGAKAIIGQYELCYINVN